MTDPGDSNQEPESVGATSPEMSNPFWDTFAAMTFVVICYLAMHAFSALNWHFKLLDWEASHHILFNFGGALLAGTVASFFIVRRQRASLLATLPVALFLTVFAQVAVAVGWDICAWSLHGLGWIGRPPFDAGAFSVPFTQSIFVIVILWPKTAPGLIIGAFCGWLIARATDRKVWKAISQR